MFRKIITVLLCLFMVAGSVIPQNNQVVYAFDNILDETETNNELVNYVTTSDSVFTKTNSPLLSLINSRFFRE